ncbi:MAG: DUF2779 domain-containing protein [Alphaproteobacteria bacterium]|nr:DUF2779 domain-containing protein [Alphaproteobacteria bacterium]
MTRRFSKSKLLAFRQCPKRLWLEVHKPELRVDSGAEVSMSVGNEVGAIARALYDPEAQGILINAQEEGFEKALERSRSLLSGNAPIFEAGFATSEAIAFADILLPVSANTWRMVEVKSATGVKDYYLDDAAIQFNVARSAGVPLQSIAIAHIDSSWTYPGDKHYNGLLIEVDVTQEASARTADVQDWIIEASAIASLPTEPKKSTGAHCSKPFECSFWSYCKSQEPQAERPVGWLPRLQRKETKDYIETKSIIDMSDVPDEYLNDIQKRVKAHTLSGTTYFDAKGAADALKAHPLPALFLDFESVNLAIPVWKGTRPYQQIPFQFSLHHVSDAGVLSHTEFLDLSGDDPCRPFAQALIQSCAVAGPIFVYKRTFEAGRIRELAEMFSDLEASLIAIIDRLVDLLPIATKFYYHPSQAGSWSIKKVLPAIAPDLDYAKLPGVKDGEMASVAYREAIQSATSPVRKDEIRAQLSAYCSLDTYAMVRLWAFFAGRSDLQL